ncbi:MAG: hypothetical protein P5702_21150 [Limnospira sp. PMC 1291.21]|uniref:Uncharacterized protein n=3 Tax=Limnospira TaxID=2596745 RepID=A0A9P1KJE3_9CYAN|nr:MULTISPECIES: hypothetical protein [Limnospira]EKD07999.1 hypothetical protein SPLC1_S300170 [Arthrospira platensis C1]MDC0836262.1 hypothetical protein [Limnoraphis robusta]MDY7055090.1 hypothetical protein [Limnospira fusiformis LS22]QJB25301.1 hypothetical protein HFV01_05170 [Limnospira fusiformis SAG 85.79]RAQ47606.1 hypothetical protein B9S53_03995 [Arthrospira sp. O9.13F]
MSYQYSEGLIHAISNVFSEAKSTYGENANQTLVHDPITDAPPEVREIIERVLQAERDKLYMKSPWNINDDVLKIIKEVIQ